jgi:hypothetical protein
MAGLPCNIIPSIPLHPNPTLPCSVLPRAGEWAAPHWTRPCMFCPSQPLACNNVCSSDCIPSMQAIALCAIIETSLPSEATIPALGRRRQYQIH